MERGGSLIGRRAGPRAAGSVRPTTHRRKALAPRTCSHLVLCRDKRSTEPWSSGQGHSDPLPLSQSPEGMPWPREPRHGVQGVPPPRPGSGWMPPLPQLCRPSRSWETLPELWEAPGKQRSSKLNMLLAARRSHDYLHSCQSLSQPSHRTGRGRHSSAFPALPSEGHPTGRERRPDGHLGPSLPPRGAGLAPGDRGPRGRARPAPGPSSWARVSQTARREGRCHRLAGSLGGSDGLVWKHLARGGPRQRSCGDSPVRSLICRRSHCWPLHTERH